MKHIIDISPPDVRNALSFIVAKSVANSFQHLVGGSFVNKHNEVSAVTCIAVAPFDDINKWIFLHHYKENLNPVEALKFYLVPLYDVIVISLNEAGAVSYIELQEYVSIHSPQDIDRFNKLISLFNGI